MPDGSQPKTANEYEIGWVLDQLNRTPGFPELRVYRNRSVPPVPLQSKSQRDSFFREWDEVQEFFSAWEYKQAFADACSGYSDLEEFESLFRAHFRDFLARQLEKEIVPREQRKIVPYWKSEPFRGLRFFDLEHAPIFHGRTKAVGDVLDALTRQAKSQTPFVLVLGASGSGKSSLVRAGVLPMLTEVGTMTGEGPWRYAITRPGAGGDPFDSLAAALQADTALPELKRANTPDDWRELELWKGLKSIGMATLVCVRDGKETAETRYYISSLPVGVKVFAHAVRSHWGIENSCHWSLDMTYREDESRIREPHLRENFAWLNRFTLSLLKQHPGKDSMVMKRRACGWSDDFLTEVLAGVSL